MTATVAARPRTRGRRTPPPGTATLRRAATDPAADPALRALLLPGLAGTPALWAPFVEHAGAFELWDAHVPWAAAGQPGWVRHRDLGGWVAATVQSCTVRGGAPPRLLVAHSFAANVLLDVLCRGGVPGFHPAGVVLVSPFYRPAPDAFDWSAIEYYLTGFHRLLDEGIRVSAGDRVGPETRAAMARQVRERVGPYGWMRFFELYLDSPYLNTAAVRTPVLVVTGELDVAAGPADAEALAAALPSARYEPLRHAGHFAMAEQPARFAALLRDFAAGLPEPDPSAIDDRTLELT